MWRPLCNTHPHSTITPPPNATHPVLVGTHREQRTAGPAGCQCRVPAGWGGLVCRRGTLRVPAGSGGVFICRGRIHPARPVRWGGAFVGATPVWPAPGSYWAAPPAAGVSLSVRGGPCMSVPAPTHLTASSPTPPIPPPTPPAPVWQIPETISAPSPRPRTPPRQSRTR